MLLSGIVFKRGNKIEGLFAISSFMKNTDGKLMIIYSNLIGEGGLMNIKKTYISYDEVDLPIAEEGKHLRKIVNEFLSGEVDDINILMYLVEQQEDYDVFYGIQFNLDDTNPNEVYRDIYLSSNIIDYTKSENFFIEIEDEHMGNWDKEFIDTLFKQLEDKPCTHLSSIIADNDFKYIIKRGFSHTRFNPDIKLLD